MNCRQRQQGINLTSFGIIADLCMIIARHNGIIELKKHKGEWLCFFRYRYKDKNSLATISSHDASTANFHQKITTAIRCVDWERCPLILRAKGMYMTL